MEDEVRWLLGFIAVAMEEERRHARRVAMLLRLFLRRRRAAARGPYCRITAFNRDVSAILNWEEAATKRHIRVTPDALRWVCARIPLKSQGWSREFEVTIFLFWLACGASFRVVAGFFSVPTSTCYTIVRVLLTEFRNIVPLVVAFPVGEELNRIGGRFAAACGSNVFSKAVGALDGTHIRITVRENQHDNYINRKLFYSIQMQGLCDDRGLFLNAFCGFPGSVHDTRVLRHSRMYLESLYPPPGYFILGDSGYPSMEHPISLVTPFRNENNPARVAFNTALSKGRIVIERAFGMLKTRWRCIFTKALEVRTQMAIELTIVCVALHNICLSLGDVVDVDNGDEELPRCARQNVGNDNGAIRENLFQRFQEERGLRL